jgi:acyl-CoA dehydrogenase
MDFSYSQKVEDYRARLGAFMDEVVYPNERTFFEQVEASEDRWVVPPVMEEMKAKARAQGLWNLCMPGEEHGGAGLRTRATWRSWPATAPRRSRRPG